MKNTILRSTLYSSLLIASISFSSCGKKEETKTEAETTTTTTAPEGTEADGDMDKPLRDTVVEGKDTIVKMGKAENPNPTEEQVP